MELNVWPKEPQTRGDRIILSATIELTNRPRKELWYEFPIETADWLTESADPFQVACILMAMRNKAKLIVHGRVSPSLVSNLAEFQKHWHTWCPRKYYLVDMQADELQESQLERTQDFALSTFTGGVDSAYTIYKHATEASPGYKVEAGLFVHGFDIPLNDHGSVERFAATARSVLAHLNARLIIISSNHKELNPDWNDTHGIGIGSCMMFLQKRFSQGLIPSSYKIDRLILPWGSNPITDPLMSSDSFSLIHDGADVGRRKKVRVLSSWSEGYDNLRVCFVCQEKDKNCGRCAKCLMTALSIRSMDLPAPKSFPEISDDDILRIENIDEFELGALAAVLRACSSNESLTGASWVQALEQSVKHNERQNKLRMPEKWLREIARAARRRIEGPESSNY